MLCLDNFIGLLTQQVLSYHALLNLQNVYITERYQTTTHLAREILQVVQICVLIGFYIEMYEERRIEMRAERMPATDVLERCMGLTLNKSRWASRINFDDLSFRYFIAF